MPSLLQSALEVTAAEPPGRVWAFLQFCGLIEPDRIDLLEALANHPRALSVEGPRASLPDEDGALARRLWSYFEVGQQLTREQVDAMSPKPAGWHGRARPCIEITD
jgi:hypothetical protein